MDAPLTTAALDFFLFPELLAQLLIAKRGSGDAVKVDFELTEGVFTKAVLKDTATVSLWLGANVMLEYSLDEARRASAALLKS